MSGTNFLQLHGSLALRAELSSWLARSRGVLAAPDRIIVTGGVTWALSLLARVLRDRGRDTVAVERSESARGVP
ncbi:hypothetical protein [Nocardiopsis sp. SBT366]|uniref:hypothetical protein n=1 Tax=Nocardiopsis sp. SBT366 TaxID=1580529 RepID=UPI00066E1B76|nr:hypothetical protein [Nocardiopsis sp. SBT366]